MALVLGFERDLVFANISPLLLLSCFVLSLIMGMER